MSLIVVSVQKNEIYCACREAVNAGLVQVITSHPDSYIQYVHCLKCCMSFFGHMWALLLHVRGPHISRAVRPCGESGIPVSQVRCVWWSVVWKDCLITLIQTADSNKNSTEVDYFVIKAFVFFFLKLCTTSTFSYWNNPFIFERWWKVSSVNWDIIWYHTLRLQLIWCKFKVIVAEHICPV